MYSVVGFVDFFIVFFVIFWVWCWWCLIFISCLNIQWRSSLISITSVTQISMFLFTYRWFCFWFRKLSASHLTKVRPIEVILQSSSHVWNSKWYILYLIFLFFMCNAVFKNKNLRSYDCTVWNENVVKWIYHIVTESSKSVLWNRLNLKGLCICGTYRQGTS